MMQHSEPFVAIDWLTFMPHLIDTLVLTFRMLTGAFAIMAIMLWWKHRLMEEDPPYNRRLNDRAWNWFYAGGLIGAVAFISLDITYRGVTGHSLGDLFVMAVWFCLANAAALRLASRVHRPRFIFLGAAVFVFGMPIYALATGA